MVRFVSSVSRGGMSGSGSGIDRTRRNGGGYGFGSLGKAEVECEGKRSLCNASVEIGGWNGAIERSEEDIDRTFGVEIFGEGNGVAMMVEETAWGEVLDVVWCRKEGSTSIVCTFGSGCGADGKFGADSSHDIGSGDGGVVVGESASEVIETGRAHEFVVCRWSHNHGFDFEGVFTNG